MIQNEWLRHRLQVQRKNFSDNQAKGVTYKNKCTCFCERWGVEEIRQLSGFSMAVYNATIIRLERWLWSYKGTKTWPKFFFNYVFIFWLHWAFIAARGLSLVVPSGSYSSLHFMGFSLWWLFLQSTGSRHTASVAVAHGLQSTGSVMVAQT